MASLYELLPTNSKPVFLTPDQGSCWILLNYLILLGKFWMGFIEYIIQIYISCYYRDLQISEEKQKIDEVPIQFIMCITSIQIIDKSRVNPPCMTGSPFLLGYECLPLVNQARLLASGIPEYYLTAADTQYNQSLEKILWSSITMKQQSDQAVGFCNTIPDFSGCYQECLVVHQNIFQGIRMISEILMPMKMLLLHTYGTVAH